MGKTSKRTVISGRKARAKSMEETVKVGLRKAVPVMVKEMSDMFEKRPPRLTKRDRREMEDGVDEYVRRSAPLINDLEALNGDPSKLPEAYEKVELLIRTWMDSAKINVHGKDSLDAYLREYQKHIRQPSAARRISHVRRVSEGLQFLVDALAADPEKEKAASKLIQEFGRHHRRQYMRYHHAFEARQRSNRNVGFGQMTRRNITVLTEEYRDGAAALEKRLQLIVGLHYIANGSDKTYSELRKLSLRNLCENIESPKNPQLHFLRNTINPTVRNALAHDGADAQFSKMRIDFVSRSETISWTISQFLKNTTRLVQTIFALTSIEPLFTYATLEKSIARFRYLVRIANEITTGKRDPYNRNAEHRNAHIR
jgi:uncharacterized protein YbgA (DUF1722 family)